MAKTQINHASTQFEIETKFVKSVSRLNRSALLCAIALTATIAIFEYIENADNAGILDIANAVNLQERQRMHGQEIGRLIELQGNAESIHEELESKISGAISLFVEESQQLKHELVGLDLLKDPVLKRDMEHASQLRLDLLDLLEQRTKQPAGEDPEVATPHLEIHAKIELFTLAMESLILRTNEIFTHRSERQDRAGLVVLVIGVLTLVIGQAGRAMSQLKSSSDSLRLMALEKNRLAVIAERTSNAVIITDLEGRIEWVNAGFTRITDYTLDEARGKKPGELLQYEKTDPATVEQIRQAVKAKQPINCQIQNRSKYGREYWLDLSIQPLHDEYGKLNGFMAVETDVSHLKEVENQIRGEQKFLASTLDSLTSRVVIINAEGFVVNANQRWIDIYRPMTDLDARQFGTTNLFQIIRSLRFEKTADCGELIDGIVRVLRSDIACFEKEYAVLEDGETRWYRSVASACTRNAQTKVVVSTEDVTVRIESEKRVKAYAGRVQAVFDGSSDAILLLKQGRFIDCNQKALEVFGLSSKDQLSHLWQFEAMLHALEIMNFSPLEPGSENHPYHDSPSLLPQVGASNDKAKQPNFDPTVNGSMSFQWLLEKVGGINFPADIFVSTVVLEGEPVILASVRDVSDRQETLRYLDMYRSIVDRHAIVAETDTAGRIVYANDQFCKISGYSRDELINQDHRILNSGTHPKQFWREMYRTVANNESWHGEICNRAKDGRLYWVDTTIAPLVNHSGKIRGYFAIRTDVTALKNAESQAQAASDAKSRFLANMSHEIRTPMTAILGFADLLAAEAVEHDKPAKYIDYIATIKRNGEHLLSIINDILDISKIEANKIEPERIESNPRHIINEVVTSMKMKALDRRIDLHVNIEASVPDTIQSDPTRIRQILLNLLGNAIKFTEKGHVSLDVQFVQRPIPQLQFVVQDTGIGLTQDQIASLFTAFYQADASTTRRFGGSGLGLQISKRLAHKLGGDLTVKSSIGIGSEFTFILPVHISLNETRTKAPETQLSQALPVDGDVIPPDKPLTGIRILLAEDGLDNQKLIAYHLRKAGAVVTIVDNGKEAVQSLTEKGDLESELRKPEPFDLLLTDIQMPEMDGYSTTRLLRSKGFETPVIALTANAMSSDAQMCIQAGCNEHVGKPIDSQQLIKICVFWSKNRPSPLLFDGLTGGQTPSTLTT